MHVTYYLYEDEEPFEYFFDPTFIAKIEEDFTGYSFSKFGYLNKNPQIKAVMQITSDGELFQGYVNHGKKDQFGRCFYNNGDFYEGGFKNERKHGQGEYRKESGFKEIANYVDDVKQGPAKFYAYNKVLDRIYTDGVFRDCENLN